MKIDKQRGLSANTIKWIAVAAMIIDHVTYAITFGIDFIEPYTLIWFLLRLPGRITAPIMCYFVAESFYYTRNKGRYLKNLFILAIISHLPYTLFFNGIWWKTTSIIWGFILGFLALWLAKEWKAHVSVKVAAIIIFLVLSLPAAYDSLIVLWILFFGIYKGNKSKQIISLVLISLFGGVSSIAYSVIVWGWTSWYNIAMLCAIPLILIYNGKRGKSTWLSKYSFYAIYPLHHLILYFFLKAIS